MSAVTVHVHPPYDPQVTLIEATASATAFVAVNLLPAPSQCTLLVRTTGDADTLIRAFIAAKDMLTSVERVL